MEESDVNRIRIYPVDAETGEGNVKPLKGLPSNAVLDEHDEDVHEYTCKASMLDSVLKLVNHRVTVLPGDAMVTEQSALLL